MSRFRCRKYEWVENAEDEGVVAVVFEVFAEEVSLPDCRLWEHLSASISSVRSCARFRSVCDCSIFS